MAVNNLSMPMAGRAAEPVTPTKSDIAYTHWMAGWSIGIAMAALSIGITIGVLQGLEHAGLNVYPYISPFQHQIPQQGMGMPPPNPSVFGSAAAGAANQKWNPFL